MELEPDNVEAINALGYSLADRTERHEEAHVLIKQALEQKPDAFYIQDSMGWVLYRMGKHAEALEYLRKAYATQADPEVAAHLGEVLWVSGNQAEARKIWREAAKLFPNDEKLQGTMERFLK
jgi:Flp pilus assembly protein TadD